MDTRKAGKLGNIARNKKLSAKRRSDIARKASLARKTHKGGRPRNKTA